MNDRLPSTRPVVLNFSPSILTHELELATAVAEIRRFVLLGRPVLAIVSAMWGVNKRLRDSAGKVSSAQDGPAYARLLSTGDQAAASLLSLALSDSRLDNALIDARSIRLIGQETPAGAEPISVDAGALAGTLERRRIVVIAAGDAIDLRGHPVLLGGGGAAGADIASVYLAAQLDAELRLVRDVNGVRESADRSAATLPSVAWDEAEAIASSIVSPAALRLARRLRTPVRIVTPGSDSGTLIGGVQYQSVESVVQFDRVAQVA